MRITFSLLAVVVLLSACDSGTSFEDEVPPVIATEAFQIDTDLFASPAKTQAGQNFAAAVLRVWPVSTIISAHLIIPTFVTAAATQADPVFDGAWIWSNTVTSEQGAASFTLTATPRAEGLDWSMQVSVTSGEVLLEEFVLYTAQTALDGKSGSWQLFYEFDDVRENVLTADFLVTDSDTKSLVFTVSGGPYDAVGDYVEYRADGTERQFEWDQESAGKSHSVRWDAVTKAGSITATDYNGGVAACWDQDFDDAACS